MANAKTKFISFRGKCKWFRATQLDPWGKWKHVLYLDADSLEKMRELQSEGVKNNIKKDEDGWFVTFNRPSQKTFQGQVKGFAPPEVLDGTQPKLSDGSYPPLREVLIGNGSDITTVCEVYEFKVPGTSPDGSKGKACRWLSSTIHNLVPFMPSTDFDEGQKRAVKHLDDLPEPIF